MPNHVTTILEADETVVASLIRTLTPEEQYAVHQKEWEEWPRMKRKTLADFEPRQIVDFDQIIPSPENKEEGGCSGTHDPGVVCWRSWNTENWGTKWGAYDMKLEGPCRVQFDTAWSHPLPVIAALSKRFPFCDIAVMYADEDLGQNLGFYRMQGGEITASVDIEEGSEEALELASQVKYRKTYAEIKKEWGE